MHKNPKMLVKTALLALLLDIVTCAPKPKACYWDSECSATHAECCIGGVCRSEGSCTVVRNYPLPNFQACFRNDDCESECCHNNFCTMEDTCDVSDATMPLVLFLVIITVITFALLSALIKDVMINRKKKETLGAS